MVEYVLIVALVSCVAIAVLRLLGARVDSSFECAAQGIDHPISARCGHGGRR